MPNILSLQTRVDPSTGRNGNITPVQPSTLTVLCILGIFAVIVYWLFLMMAMPETQPAFAIFLDR